MFKLKQLLVLFCFFYSINSIYSQFGFSHEVGVITGPVAFQSDFGERKNWDTNKGNTGIGVGIIHYLNFSYRADCNCYTTDTYFNDHFKLRNEVSWNMTKLNHFGPEAEKASENSARLRAHSGETNNLNIGTQLEWFPMSIRDFAAGAYKIAPYGSIGGQFTYYSPKAMTTYGDGDILNEDNIFYEFHDGAINTESGTTWSVVASVGARYKLTILSDLLVDLRWQYYFTNWTDGLNHQETNIQDKANDWLVWLNVGYVYYLD
ncbi:MAG: glutamate dehydrogenase [Bacteroidia bacterium]|nr:glutamate dehydrogenase [Bacteroidia bacterium]MBT8310418.1 glutamate dehydrogenase [Bacteroidia bacterium]NND12129.1 glutamate dehydrogenase [Flavobacteriaceae bacterium]NNK28371.1 glutamate dehydrogenase [Flavobacteriaceae bacterium]NNL59871.1 glutamate dehydrogenase [Flavobacteriaceae bacterium]